MPTSVLSINRKGFAPVLALIILACLVVIGFILYISVFNKGISINQTNSTVSGIIDLNGVMPKGATISIAGRKLGSKTFTTVISNLPAKDLVTWSYNSVVKNQVYEVQAYLMVNSKKIASSGVDVVTAPAFNEVLTLDVVSNTPTNTPAAISGTFGIDGYVPPQSTLSVAERIIGTSNFTTVITGASPVDGSAWNWPGAVAGADYEVQASLINQAGTVIGQSSTIVVAAPAANEVLNLNSTAQPVSTTSVVPSTGSTNGGIISGTINLNGVAPAGSSLIIVSRPSGTVPFNVVVSGLSPSNQTAWSWAGATPGQSYDLQAVLTVNGNDAAISNTITVAAPAASEVFTISATGGQLSTPPQGPFVSCAGQANGLDSVNITFNYVGQAAMYWVQLGNNTSSGAYINSPVVAQNSSGQTQQSVTSGYVLTPGVTYFAQYSYSNTPNSTLVGSYSPWSNQTSFTCN